MAFPIQVSGKGIDLAPDLEAQVRAAVGRLERFHPRVVGGRVVVAVPHRRPTGDPVAWSIRLVLTVPGGELAISRQAKPSFGEALDDAVEAGRRQLQDYARETRGDVKAPAEEMKGKITELFAYEGYGFLLGVEGTPVYFHRNSVPGDGFDRLAVGMEVRYVATEGLEGPQATTVVPLAHQAQLAGGGEGEGGYR